MHDILGMNPIVISTLLVIGGVGLHCTLGWLQSKSKPDPRRIAASVIIASFTAFGVVTPIIQHLLVSGASEYVQFAAGIGALATIAGVDQLVKNTGNIIILKIKSK